MLIKIRRRLREDVISVALYYKNRQIYKCVAKPYKVIYVSAKNKRLRLQRKDKVIVEKHTIPGQIIDGDWDIYAFEQNQEENTRYISRIEHFVNGIPWEKTTIFRNRWIPMLAEKGECYGCSSIEELVERYKRKNDHMYDKIKRKGVVTRTIKNPFIDVIYVHVGRNGEFIYTDNGNHRLAIADLLGIKKIPVRVWTRHKKWQEIRDNFEELLCQPNSKTISMLKCHADLQDLLNKE